MKLNQSMFTKLTTLDLIKIEQSFRRMQLYPSLEVDNCYKCNQSRIDLALNWSEKDRAFTVRESRTSGTSTIRSY